MWQKAQAALRLDGSVRVLGELRALRHQVVMDGVQERRDGVFETVLVDSDLRTGEMSNGE